MPRSVLTKILYALEIFLALGAFYGGWSLLTDPTGNSLKMPAAMFLVGTPFDDYLIPGLVLFIVNGAFPVLVIVACLMDQPWAKWGHVAVGALLTGWMVVQMALIGATTTIQFVFLGLGIVILALGLMLRPKSETRPPSRLAASH
jgi:hypothetical protein